MVSNIFTLSTLGLRDWLTQRVTAILIGAYTLLIMGYLIFHPQLQFDEWQMLFAHSGMKIFSFLVLFSVILHGWIGIWTVFTDYVKNFPIRMFLQILIIILLFCCLAWGAEILWGV